ncbi:hypothetical protein K503DRAFT_861438 [Rhizopogon vinicolor AM-OR11-026]|uniref:Uncharacterized protein n=1 Tax=Rhizopogon vinicolor AM-OR11-026 TaxID=1314800 RepID=A0A1B7NHU8_9AGAM|nr:hypothetical protein K503DRAFT_861438 [Rhizopogon vinicolor AM-OR11-026]
MAPPRVSNFHKPQYFTPDASHRGWTCNVCISRRKNQIYFPNLKAALRHEKTSSEHARHISEAEWWKPQDDRWGLPDPPPLTSEGLRTWEMQTHVDHVYDLVPFWMRAVDAAERGEVLRLEEFLQKMEGDGGWRSADQVWGMLGAWRPNHQGGSDGWGNKDGVSTRKGGGTDSTSDNQDKGWGVKEAWAVLSNHSSNSSHRDTERASGTQTSQKSSHVGVTHPFVDDIALQEAADEEKRQQMHRFFEMSTEQKVLKIQETIRYLRTHPA